MIEIYLRLVDRALTPVIVVVAIILFLRGHDYPGGGFIAGLTVAAAIELQILAQGATPVRERFGRYLLPLVGLGLLYGRQRGAAGHVSRRLFQRHVAQVLHSRRAEIKVGTPQLFDLGVMLVVIGMTSPTCCA
jgi:multisubunit Na+/H+ antiporter MnhB subunit